MKNEETQQFNNAAKNYDEVFTNSCIGKLQRKRVYSYLDEVNFFDNQKEVFEINCGTGYDAEQFLKRGHKVVATDGSSEMITYAKENRSEQIDFQQLDFNQLTGNEMFSNSNVLFSNFGGLNCISGIDLRELVINVTKVQRKKDLLIWVIMPEYCLMETFYLALKLQFGKLFRRKTIEGVLVNVEGSSVRTFYHSPNFVKGLLKKGYNIKKVKPVAAFLPPSYLEPFFFKQKWLLNILYTLEKMFGSFGFLAGVSDHYIIIAEKR